MIYQKLKSDWKLLTISVLAIVFLLTILVHYFFKSGLASLEGMLYAVISLMATIVVTTFSFVFVA